MSQSINVPFKVRYLCTLLQSIPFTKDLKASIKLLNKPLNKITYLT